MIEAGVDRSSQQKLYVQIYDIIKSKVEQGAWVINQIIPSEDELCRLFHVSKATVRLAVADLVRDGYLVRQQGKGTFVKSVVPHLGMTIRTRFTEEPFGNGQRLDREMVAREMGRQSAEASRYLDGDETFLHARFYGRIKGEPASVEDLYVIARLVPGIETVDLVAQPFFEAIQERSLRKIERVVQTIDVMKAHGDIAGFLQVKEGAVTIVVYRIFVDSEERPIAFTKLIGKVGKYKVQNEFERIR